MLLDVDLDGVTLVLVSSKMNNANAEHEAHDNPGTVLREQAPDLCATL